MSLVKKTYTIKGCAPLIINSDAMADPLNPMTKELTKLTGKRKKTAEDHSAISDIQWRGKFHVNVDGIPVVTAGMLEATLRAGARKKKLGKQFEAGVHVFDNPIIKHNNGTLTVDNLEKHPEHKFRSMVVIQRNRVATTRPIFPTWELTFDVMYSPGIVDEDQIDEAILTAGEQCGLGDWRPRFGRFEVLTKS
jgi:hypothetical protein